ncbi:MAG: hypothetical protein JNK02_13635 [Planctomycetes bacterium]|nr:hypothetical protein [Planctomycetota bacterium]
MDTQSLQDGILRAVRRAEVPSLLFADDIQLHLGVTHAEAVASIQAGYFGPWFTVAGKPAVLRETLREHVRARSAQARAEDRELLTRRFARVRREARDDEP